MADLTLLDPAMLADHSHRDGEPDSGWEYEYHESQTEVFVPGVHVRGCAIVNG